jgi:hypothetical protein
MPRGGGVRPSPPELGNMVPRGGPTHPLGIAERWHRNLLSLAKERNPGARRRGVIRHLVYHARCRSRTTEGVSAVKSS